jgi:ribosome biogenesis GTPase
MANSETFTARVIVSFGRQARVRRADGSECGARAGQRKLEFVCGDSVTCRGDAQHEEVHIVSVAPRLRVLERSNARGGGEAVVANIDLLVAVIAPAPQPDLFLLDRYLAAAHAAGLSALIVVNKVDLEGGQALLESARLLAQALNLHALACSADSGHGIAALRDAIGGRVAVLVGQSGVGKSSLLRLLVPAAEARVQALDRDAEGRHTTTRSESFDLEGGGAIIDSPGVRDFAPAIATLPAGHLGFADIAALAGGCRFGDCRHWQEPHCAVRDAAQSGRLDPRRYESYRRLRRLYENLRPAPGSARR